MVAHLISFLSATDPNFSQHFPGRLDDDQLAGLAFWAGAYLLALSGAELGVLVSKTPRETDLLFILVPLAFFFAVTLGKVSLYSARTIEIPQFAPAFGSFAFTVSMMWQVAIRRTDKAVTSGVMAMAAIASLFTGLVLMLVFSERSYFSNFSQGTAIALSGATVALFWETALAPPKWADATGRRRLRPVWAVVAVLSMFFVPFILILSTMLFGFAS
ncbi:MAG: hypothetical protein NT137_08245 [Methanomassiliicoccales archaeon]|nr:hypothetical protein [Methanomassiliicoccales archaeon]